MRALLLALALALAVCCSLAACGSEAPEGTADRFEDVAWRPLPTGEVQRIAFGSCAHQWAPQPIWATVVATKPDLYLSLGDAIYGDWDGKQVVPFSEASMTAGWRMLADHPDFTQLRAAVPVMATWDNHDYGKHDGGAEFEHRALARRMFLDFFGEPLDSPRRRRPGVHDARIFGPEGRRVQVILLDTRSFKGPTRRDPRTKAEKQAAGLSGSMGRYVPNMDASTTLLGEAQWSWFEQQLAQPADLRLICSSTQVIPDQKGMDEWGNYPRDRMRLFKLLESAEVRGVLLLSGNVHFGELSGLKRDAYPLLEFTASGLTHINGDYAQFHNPYRMAGPVGKVHFGLVEVDWAREGGPRVRLRAIGEAGETLLTHEVPLRTLGG
ncbi:MAG: alkaline phosphatase D family protein [Planctomycetota bacterium]|nr:alkaline phosphatase D family protein [Planctomycetota bacterium]